jgi:hypothetical protein
MKSLIALIFDTPSHNAERLDYDLTRQERILIQHGMNHRVVKELVKRVFDHCIDSVAESIPYLAYDESQEIYYDMADEFDVMVTVIVYLDDEDVQLNTEMKF